ncbi:MAG: (d)CMP kinase [Parvibaculales bacterium]
MTTSVTIIAVDGTAASGKGTLAKKLAAHFNFAYLDTGALYRGVALQILQILQNKGGLINDAAIDSYIESALQKLDFDWLTLPETQPLLRTAEISKAASLVATKPQVRASILAYQRDFARSPPQNLAGAVLDGRDIGTIVCPHAHHKLFITARLEIRAKRRWQELIEKNYGDESPPDFAVVLADIEKRDAQDSQRAIAPLKQAEDALLLDSSDLSIEEVFLAALALIEQTDA